MHPQRIVISSAIGVAVLGVLLPWAQVGVLSIAGIQTWPGKISLVCLGIALLISIIERRAEWQRTGDRVATTCFAGVSLFMTIYIGAEISLIASTGLYLTGLGSLVVMGASLWGRRWLALGVFMLGILVMIAGDIHIVYGGNLDYPTVCQKEHWSFNDEAIEQNGVMDDSSKEDLIRCGVVHAPQGEVTYCAVKNSDGNFMSGTCKPTSTCRTPSTIYRGYCEGPDEIACCVAPF